MSGLLKNVRHEAFARELAKGKTQNEAYRAAGYKPDRCHASRLATNGNVLTRIAELQEKAAERLVVTVASLIAEAEEARKGATEAGQYSAAIAAIKEKGILSGVRVEKRENAEARLSSALKEMTDEDLEAILAAIKEIELRSGDGAPASKGEAEQARRFN